MRNHINKNKTILSIMVCVSVSMPVICMPFGVRGGEQPAIIVRRAYADMIENNTQSANTIDENTITQADINELIDYELSEHIANGGTVQATYLAGFGPAEIINTDFDDIETYTIYQQLDASGLPVELLDPLYFAPDDTTYYIAAANSILKQSPDMDSITLQTLDYGVGVTRIGIGDTWSKIRTEDGVEGFVLTNTLSYEMVWTAVDRIVWVDTSSLTLRAEASVESEVLGTLYNEDRLRVTMVADKWFKVTTEDGTEGYVYSSYTTTQAPPTPTPTPIPVQNPPQNQGSSSSSSGSSSSTSSSSSSSSSASTNYNNYSAPLITGVNRESIVSAAESMLGQAYVWGACSSTAVDCSGLVVYCYGLVGISLPHQSQSLCSVGQGVSREDIAPGDIVCWDNHGDGICGHVGLYVGDGQCIEARGARWGVVYCDLDRSPIITIRRVIE